MISELDPDSLQILVPLIGGGVIVIATLLIALIRGMTSGVIVALLIGSVMSVGPIALASSRTGAFGLAQSTAETVESAATVARDNRRVLGELEQALEAALAALEALVRRGDGAGSAELARVREEFDLLRSALDSGAEAEQTLEADLEALQIEMRRSNFRRRRTTVQSR